MGGLIWKYDVKVFFFKMIVNYNWFINIKKKVVWLFLVSFSLKKWLIFSKEINVLMFCVGWIIYFVFFEISIN